MIGNTDEETPRLDPVPGKAGLPQAGYPSPDETEDGLLPADAAPDADEGPDVGRVAADLGLDLPDDPQEAAAVLLHALLTSQQQAGEYLAMTQRVAADFENYRKRVERDYAQNLTRASQRLVERLLPALDSFEAAISYEAQSPAENKILDGIRGTHSQLMEILAAEGLAPITTVGTPFDPAVHEAVAGPDGDGDGPLMIAEELRRGYLMKDRVLRPSLVVVEHS